MKNITELSLKNRDLVWYFVIVTFIAGIFSYYRLGRMEDPAFTIRMMVVSAAWPGATAAEMEQQHHDGQERPDAGADRAAGRAEADRQRHRHQAVADQLHAVGEERQPRVAVGVGEGAEEERQRLERRRGQEPHPVGAGELGHLPGRSEGR